MTLSHFFTTARRFGLRRRDMAVILALSLLQSLLEACAVLSFLPILQFIQAKGDLVALKADHWQWQVVQDAFARIGLDVSLGALLLVAFALTLMRQAVQYANAIFVARVRVSLTQRLRETLFDAFLHSDLTVIERESSGRIANDFSIEVDTAATSLILSLHFVKLLILSATYLATLLVVSVPLTVLACVLMIVTGLVLRKLLQRAIQVGEDITASNQEIGGFLLERLRGLRLMRLSGSLPLERQEVRARLDRQRTHRLMAEKIAEALSALVEPIFIGLALVCLWFGSTHAGLGLDAIGVFLVVILRMMPIGKDIFRARQNVLQTMGALAAIEGRLDQLTTARERWTGTKPVTPLRRAIDIDNVVFSYPDTKAGEGGTPALAGVSFSIPAGQMTALVGPSGSGKSTVIDLLPGLRRPQGGQIRFDDVLLDDIRLDDLRAAIGFVPQSPQIFDLTIGGFIRYGNADIADQEVREALKLANCLSFVDKLPEGLDTRIREAGVRLSGGQRQRLDLARVLARKTPIIVLDEPTSALDAESELFFRKALQAIRAERAPTIVLIVHHLPTAMEADWVVVLNDGRVEESGRPSGLLNANGWFARSLASQSGHVRLSSVS